MALAARALADAQFAVVGVPAPEGSTSFRGMRGGKPIIVHDSAGLEPWRRAVSYAARQAMAGRRPFGGRIRMEYVFVMPRPLKLPSGRTGPTVPPDVDKLMRGVNDACTRIVFLDDAQVTEGSYEKRYPADAREQTGVIVRAWALDPQQQSLDIP